MANYKKVAEQILSTVGGAENVASVTHCMTRLRFNLKDESLSNDEKLEDISSIISVVHAGGQVQLVVGPTVDKVYDEVCKQGGFEVTVSIDEELDGPQLSWKERLAPKHLFNQLLDAVSGAIPPMDLEISMAMGVVTDLGVSEKIISRDAPISFAMSTTDTIPVMQPANCEITIFNACFLITFICL